MNLCTFRSAACTIYDGTSREPGPAHITSGVFEVEQEQQKQQKQKQHM